MGQNITRTTADWISPALRERLIAALTPIELGATSTKYEVGYWRAQQDFRRILEHKSTIRLGIE